MKLLAPPRSLTLFLSHVKVVWRHWDVQTMVLTSFAIQVILVLVGPFRKQSSDAIIIVSIWLAYLLADWVAAQAIGLIAKPCGLTTSITDAGEGEMYAFWAQFLLLYLGGPDTITALALEDSELWLRTGLHLSTQVYSSLGVLVRSVAKYRSSLWAPTMLMFVAGILKYLERVSSLFHGRLRKFSIREVDWTSLDEYKFNVMNDRGNEKELTNVEIVRDAFYFFHHYKGLYADQKFQPTRRMHSKKYLLARTSEEAFKVLEIQLNFAYEVFYTKTVVIYTTRLWKILRVVVALLQVGCLVIWLLFTDKHGFPLYNIQITYTLLFGAIVVELFALIRMHLSNWNIAKVQKDSPTKGFIYNRMVPAFQNRSWGEYWRKKDAPTLTWFKRLLFRRWSESITQLNLISMCMDQQPPNILQTRIQFWQEKEELEQQRYVNHRWFSNDVRDFVFEDLKEKAKKKDALKNIGHVKGGWACNHNTKKFMGIYRESTTGSKIDFTYTVQLFNINWDYDVILLRCHIITEVMYIADEEIHVDNGAQKNLIKCLKNKVKGHIGNTNTGKDLEQGHLEVTNTEERYRELCKTLSDYMFYLFIHQSDLMPVVSEDTKTRYKKLCKTLKESLEELARRSRNKGLSERKKAHREACQLIRIKFKDKPENPSDNVLNFPIKGVIDELEALKKVDKWKFMAEVWSELLYYAALRCKASVHAAKLKEDGQLISLVWLLLFQLGFGLYEGVHSQRRLKDSQDERETALLYFHQQ